MEEELVELRQDFVAVRLPTHRAAHQIRRTTAKRSGFFAAIGSVAPLLSRRSGFGGQADPASWVMAQMRQRLRLPLPFPHIDNLFCPRQSHLSDVPRLPFNVLQPAAALVICTRARLRRAQDLALVVLGERLILVLPLPNPFMARTTRSGRGISHHGVDLKNPNDPTRKVVLYFRDTDEYFTGFQRVPIHELEDGTKQEEGGACFFFDDFISKNEVPEFMDAVKMGIRSNHVKCDFPRPEAMEALFHTFAGFEDQIHIHDTVVNNRTEKEVRGMSWALRQELELAVGRVIVVFFEISRLLDAYELCFHGRICYRTYTSVPTSKMQSLTKLWGAGEYGGTQSLALSGHPHSSLVICRVQGASSSLPGKVFLLLHLGNKSK